MASIRTKEDIKPTMEDASTNGIISKSEKETIEKLIINIVEHPLLQHCFSIENEIITERTILSSEGKFHIPDRIETTPGGETTIIDYKTGDKSPAHTTQVNTYEKLLTEMGYIVTQKLLVYTNDQVDVLMV